MKEKQNIVPLKELNLSNRFLFDQVMEDPEIHREVLNIVLEKEIPPLRTNVTEKEVRKGSETRYIRVDIYAEDEEDTVYNTEMQKQKKNDLRKRSRFYQGLLDSRLLESGVPNYNLLKDTYLIMIACFDPFGYGRYRYTFEAQCQEEPKCKMEDGAVRIFLNVKGKNDDEVSEELREFLYYVEHTTDEAAERSKSVRIKKIHERVKKVKEDDEVGVKYMQAWEERYYEMQEARKEGLSEGLETGRREGLSEGLVTGEWNKLIEQVKKKLQRDLSVEEIADMLEEPVETIQKIIVEIQQPVG